MGFGGKGCSLDFSWKRKKAQIERCNDPGFYEKLELGIVNWFAL